MGVKSPFRVVAPQNPKKPTNPTPNKQKKPPKPLPEPQQQCTHSVTQKLPFWVRDLLLCRPSCTREMQELAQGRCRSHRHRDPALRFCLSDRIVKLEPIVHGVFRHCFTGRLISIKFPGLPVAQIDLMNTVLCVLGFIIPHDPPSQFCTR